MFLVLLYSLWLLLMTTRSTHTIRIIFNIIKYSDIPEYSRVLPSTRHWTPFVWKKKERGTRATLLTANRVNMVNFRPGPRRVFSPPLAPVMTNTCAFFLIISQLYSKRMQRHGGTAIPPPLPPKRRRKQWRILAFVAAGSRTTATSLSHWPTALER